jgi:hypothetical protein
MNNSALDAVANPRKTARETEMLVKIQSVGGKALVPVGSPPPESNFNNATSSRTLSTFHRLKFACTEWRQAEREYARAVLTAQHPQQILDLADTEARALARLRLMIDSEPWAEIATEYLYLSKDKLSGGGVNDV